MSLYSALLSASDVIETRMFLEHGIRLTRVRQLSKHPGKPLELFSRRYMTVGEREFDENINQALSDIKHGVDKKAKELGGDLLWEGVAIHIAVNGDCVTIHTCAELQPNEKESDRMTPKQINDLLIKRLAEATPEEKKGLGKVSADYLRNKMREKRAWTIKSKQSKENEQC